MTAASRRRLHLAGSLATILMLAILVAGIARPCEAAPRIQRVVAGDVEAWLVEDHANPIIALQLAFRSGGSASDPADRGGLARMTAALLDEGAGDLDSQAFQGRLQDLSIHLGFDAGLDTLSGSLETLTQNREAAFDLLRLALTQPRFDAEAVTRIRSQLEAQLRRSAEDPNAVASRRLWAEMFPGLPYGRPVDGDEQSIGRIGQEDLRRFVRERMARDRVIVGVVGDLTPAELAPLLQRTFGGLPATAAASTVADVRPVAAGTVVTIDMDVPQSAIAFAQPGLKRSDPRFYALTILNQILGGGGLSSRLFEEVREKRGLVYSVSTALVPLDHAGVIVGGAGTQTASVAEAIGVIRSEWRRLATDGVTPAELADAKTYLTGSFPLRFAGSSRLAGLLVSIRRDDLGIDYLERRNALIASVTEAQANALAKDLLAPEQLAVVVVGRTAGEASTAHRPPGLHIR